MRNPQSHMERATISRRRQEFGAQNSSNLAAFLGGTALMALCSKIQTV
jgi:hypothetical protein